MESRKAPKLLVRPDWRAMAPSMRSEKTKAVMTSTPTSSWPCGKKTTAPAQTPRVPTSVTTSGLTPARSRPVTTGLKKAVQNARNLSIMARSGYRPTALIA